MRTLWIWYLPLFFLPSFGLTPRTAFGQLELSDFVMIPFLPLIALSPKIQGATLRGVLKKRGMLFVTWALASILWIYIFYQYDRPMPVLIFSFLKLGKFLLYCTAGLMISRSLTSEAVVKKYHFGLVLAGAVTGLALAVTTAVTRNLPPAGAILGFKATNLISVGLAIMFAYIFVLHLRGYGSAAWRKLTLVCLVIMLLGSTYSGGRGGWLAALAGMAFALGHTRIRMRTVMISLSLCLGVLGLYVTNAAFKHQVDHTIFPNEKYLERYNFGVAGVDDGGRITTWIHEAAKIFSSPIFGTGFFHRGAPTGLWATGSHNFWIQMYLETGLVGGTLILYLFVMMWTHAQRYSRIDKDISLALKCGLIAAFIGGMSGEYFYGGYALSALLLIYAPVGSMTIGMGSAEPEESDAKAPA